MEVWHISEVPRRAAFDVILFDLDGTLTDSAPGIVNCLRYALDDLGIAHPDAATIRSQLGPPLSVTFTEYYGLDEATTKVAIEKYRERFHDLGMFENSVYPGVPELLDALDQTSATLAVATSKPTPSATRILEHFGLSTHFAFIGGAELDGPRQHKADVIAHTLDELSTMGSLDAADSLVMVGDRRHDIAGAAVHGIPGIGVLWGYGDEEELVGAGASEIVPDPAALLDLLTRR